MTPYDIEPEADRAIDELLDAAGEEAESDPSPRPPFGAVLDRARRLDPSLAVPSPSPTDSMRGRLDDGALALYLVSSQNGEEFASVLGAFARGAIEDNERIDMRYCRACRVASPSAKFSYTVDGDALERSEPLHVKCIPAALNVLSP